MKERRSYVRIPARGLLQFKPIHLPTNVIPEEEAIFQDISLGGVRFETDRPLRCGEVVRIELQLNSRVYPSWISEVAPFEDHQLKTLAKVVYCGPLEGGDGFLVGASFLGLDTQQQNQIMTLIQDYFSAVRSND